MQYKKIIKIVIDKRKLDVLLRLGCPDKQLLEIIKTGSYTPTGDSLIDETLECLVDIKEFSNWGGNHNPTGKNQHSSKNNGLGQVDHQVDHQDEGQDIGQVVDKDIDKEINNNLNNINNLKHKIGSKVVNIGKCLIDENFNIFDVPDVEIYVKEVGEGVVLDVQAWLKKKMLGKLVDKTFICQQIYNFSLRNGLVGEL